ncbi:unnamed protein product [Brachionus calyciflorus]|uniref:Transposase domain-containing protein n=1 Tax=Brachionus calyciflorus TaxID=104777 RepID=A0A813YPI8_9BILA|nr:unnamed protein product [Brachionus calyciflorus]
MYLIENDNNNHLKTKNKLKFNNSSDDDIFFKKKLKFDDAVREQKKKSNQRYQNKKEYLTKRSSSLENVSCSYNKTSQSKITHFITKDDSHLKINTNLDILNENFQSRSNKANLNISSESYSDYEDFEDNNDLNMSFSSDDPMEDLPNINSVLYENSKISLNEFISSIMAIKIRHSLPDNAINHILQLIRFILPNGNRCPKTLRSYEKKFLENQDVTTHRVCSYCSTDLEQPFNEYKNDHVFCNICKNNLSTFFCFNVEPQILNILSNQTKFNQIIETNRNAKLRKIDQIECAIDGSIYQKSIREKNENTIQVSISLNTDGCPINKSRSFNIWPLFGTILELNQSTRESFENILILGLRVNLEKPCYKLFFEKSVIKLKEILQKTLDYNGYRINFRCQNLIVDLPARAVSLSITQFNGKFGCSTCFHPGKYSFSFRKMIYPPLKFKIKTNKDYERLSSLLCPGDESVFGITGISPFKDILIIPEQVQFDYMHLVLQGHVKWLLKELFENKQSEFYIGFKIDEINSFLANVKFPHSQNRRFNCIDVNRKIKSSELKVFILYLAVPILKRFLDPRLFMYLCLYIFSIRIFYEPIFDLKKLETAKEMIELYYQLIEEFYGESAYTYTIHAHLHLYDQGAIGNLKKFVNGTNAFIGQIARKLLYLKYYKSNLKSSDFNNQVIFEFIERVIDKKQKSNDQLIKPFSKRSVTINEKEIFKESFDFDMENEIVLTSDRLFAKNIMYHSYEYCKSLSSDSSLISYLGKSGEEFGRIMKFFEINGKIFVLVYFKKDNSYTILNDSKNGLVNQEKAKVKFDNKWVTGEIKYRGTQEKCELYGKKLGPNKTFKSSESESELPNKSNRSNIKNKSSSNPSKKKKKTYEQNLKDVDVYFEKYKQNSIANSSASMSPSTSSSSGSTALQGRHKRALEDDNILNEKNKEDNWPTEIKYGDKNLLNIQATTWNKYVTGLMEVLFTFDERLKGRIYGENSKKEPKRIPLSPNRFELLKQCSLIKAKAPPDQLEKVWKDAMNIANRKCYDAEKESKNKKKNN